MDAALTDQALLAFIKERGTRARYVASKRGRLPPRKSGPFRRNASDDLIGGAESLREMFPKARVEGDKHVVVDGNLVTTIGGAVSDEGSLARGQELTGQTQAPIAQVG